MTQDMASSADRDDSMESGSQWRKGDTLGKLLRKGARFLECHGVPDAANDAWLLLEYCTGIDRTRYYIMQETVPETKIREEYHALLKKRAQRIPLQQLTGRQWFCGLEFWVNDQVLIPRQDTECLVETALEILRPGMRVLDLCTGSGCIIISLAKLARQPGLSFYGADLSAEALQVARANAKRFGVDVTFSQGDLFEGAEGTYDCVISNPPYISRAELTGLMPEVRDHEPRMALDGGEDGLQFYRRIVRECGEKLNTGGWLLFEIGAGQGEAVSALMRECGSLEKTESRAAIRPEKNVCRNAAGSAKEIPLDTGIHLDAGAENGWYGFQEIEVRRDLAGLDRIVLGRRG